MKIYAVVSSVLFAVFLLLAFAVQSKKKFEEIDVERINIVEKDGIGMGKGEINCCWRWSYHKNLSESATSRR